MERLPPTAWMTAPSLRAVIDALEAAGGEGCARFVGGCVRDTLLGRGDEVADVDIATPLTPPEVIAALKAAGLKSVPTGVDHGTVTAISEGRPYEITTLRRDVQTDGRRAVVAFTTSWEEDAQRRDFRLNALYADPDGVIHDPTGGGLDDVAARRIVFVGDPETRIREDYLRILRFFRFLARVGDAAQADPDGLAACAKLKDGIAGLSGERVQQEMFKLLGSPNPWPATERMEHAGVDIVALPDTARWASFHLSDFLILEAELGDPPSVILRLAALTGPSASSTADRLRLSKVDRARLRDAWDLDSLETGSSAAVHRAIYRLGASGFGDRVRMACLSFELTWKQMEEALADADWSPPPFPVTGEEIKALGVPEGPLVGVVRKALEDWWVEGAFTATKAEALAELEVIVKKLSPSWPPTGRG